MQALYVENSQLQSSNNLSKTDLSTSASSGITIGGLNLKGGIPQYTKVANVTQITNMTTGVTSNGAAGQITTVSFTTATTATSTFTVTNSSVLATSYVTVAMVSYGGTILTNGIPIITVSSVSAGSFNISVLNAGANALSGVFVLQYKVY